MSPILGVSLLSQAGNFLMLLFIGLSVLLLVGHFLRTHVRLLRTLYLPSCVIGGLVGLAAVQCARAVGRPVPAPWTANCAALPSLLINVVFACLFLGVTLPRASQVWRRAGPQVVYGQLVAWGQYVVGIGLVLAVLIPAFDLPTLLGSAKAAQMFAGILPVGFEGGHGTASGMGPVFQHHGWAAGQDFAMASATAGILSAVIVGMVLVNWATRRGYTVRRQEPADVPEDHTVGIIPVGRRPEAGRLSVSSDSIEAFSLHLCAVAVAIFIGYALQSGLVGLEKLLAPGTEKGLLSSFPLFPLCMLGGLAVQIFEQRLDRHKLIDSGLVRRIQNTALDFLVVAAIAAIRLEVVTACWLPLVILVGAGILWNVFCVVFLARRLLPDAWFERSIAEMGQSMGVTATGLLLLRVVDPDYESPAADAFAYKQLVHEPFMGGGLWTSMAIPLLALYGGVPVFCIAAGAMAVWVAVAVVPRLLARRE